MATSEARPNSLTLYQIEDALLQLVEMRDDPTLSEEERAVVEQTLVEYVTREVEKVDNIRGFLRHCKLIAAAARQEAADQEARARMWEAREERLKEIVKQVSEMGGRKRFEGRTGVLRVQGNGGLAPLIIMDASQVPEECCKYVGWIAGDCWQDICHGYDFAETPDGDGLLAGRDFKLERVVDNDLVRKALPVCERCGGSGTIPTPAGTKADKWPCPDCLATGRGGVPGAHLGERGTQVRVE